MKIYLTCRHKTVLKVMPHWTRIKDVTTISVHHKLNLGPFKSFYVFNFVGSFLVILGFCTIF
jgi:hypothetical protein